MGFMDVCLSLNRYWKTIFKIMSHCFFQYLVICPGPDESSAMTVEMYIPSLQVGPV